jgi:hypothetical protein
LRALAEARHAAVAPRRKLVTIVLAVVAVLGAGALAFALTGGNDGPLGSFVPGTGEPDRVTPEFAFRAGKAQAVPTVASQSAEKLKGEAERASREATAVVDDLYTAAFLDPENWTNGTYDSAFEVFDEPSGQEARSSLAALTAGASAGETFDDIQPGRGVIESEVLMDAKGQAARVVARVTFTARGTNKDGTITLFVSEGEFFLRSIDGDWKVVAFDVRRNDKVKEPAPSPSVSAGATPSGVTS